MIDKKQAGLIMHQLGLHYPLAKSGLVFSNPYQLFVATLLSAQTTDEQVNKVTADLFRAAPTIYEMAQMSAADIEPYIKSIGLFRYKSRYLAEASRIIVVEHYGEIPADFDELVKLPGVGRKTANVIISGAFGQPAIAVDTHVFRVSRRLGLAGGNKVEQVEEQLKEVIPVSDWSVTHHRLITHGRQVCHARSPECQSCFLAGLCSQNSDNIIESRQKELR